MIPPTQQQSQRSLPFSKAQQSSSTGSVKDIELEDVQELEVNGRLDAAVNEERIVSIQTSEPEPFSPAPSEILMDGNSREVAKSEERVSEVGAKVSEVTRSGPELAQVALYWHSSGTVTDNKFWPDGNYSIENAPSTALDSDTVRGTHAEILQDNDVGKNGDCSGSELAHVSLVWHSSGTVTDNSLWLHGICSIENAPSTAPVSNAARGGTHAEVIEEKDIGQDGDGPRKRWFSGAKPVIDQSEKTFSSDPTFEDLAEANKDNEEAEFELDSSPLGSHSSCDDSTDTSSSNDSDADDYEMLGPAEQARRLMAEDGGSGDDGKGKGRKVVAELPRTLNEKLDELVPKPTVVVTDVMKIEELGPVENTVDNLALIKANTSGEYQVLESGSLLCLQDRSVIGVVSETLGRVQQPFYTVRFTNATAIAEAGIEKNTKIFYVAQHSTTVFTQPLKAFKGSDASNLHDEEVGDDELEFSDDEAEAEHKRQIKQQRTAKRTARDGQPARFSCGSQQRSSGPSHRLNGGLHPAQERPPNSAEAVLNYDDADGMNFDDNKDQDGPYTPLVRPSNLHEILSGKAPPVDNHTRRGNTNRGRSDTRGGNRGRGDNRGRGGNLGVRDLERGGKQNRKDYGNRGRTDQSYGHRNPATPQTNGFSPSQPNGLPPRPRPETVGYQRSTHQGNGVPYSPPQQLPVPSPVYQIQEQPQSHTHPGYPSQYPNAYSQPILQPPTHQSYPSYFPQQNHSQYHQPQQSISRQGYLEQFAPRPDMSFPPRPQYPPSIPPGAHINPNFFKQQGQSASPQGWQQGYNQQQQQQQQVFSASNSTDPTAPLANPTSLQELLRGLGRGVG